MDPIQRKLAIKAIEDRVTTLRIGQSTQQERVYTGEQCAMYAQRMGIPYPGPYVSVEGDLLVPPSLFFLRPAATFAIMDRKTPLGSYAGIFTSAHRYYFKPARVGYRICFEGEIVDLYESRGFYYLTVKWEATEENGMLLARGEEGHTFGFVRKES